MTTPNLMLPEVPVAIQTASDELNAGFLSIDAVLQLAVISRAVTAPPAGVIQGQRYIIPAGATGAWASRVNHIAFRGPAGWLYFIPRPGWLAWSIADAAFYVYTAGAWSVFSAGGGSAGNFAKGATWVRAIGAIETPAKDAVVYLPNACTIVGVSLLTIGGPGSCVADIWKKSVGSYPPSVSDSICASAKPTIASGRTYVDTTLTGWTVDVDAGDVLTFHLDSSSTFTAIYLSLALQEVSA
jgi:hypothetical protein